METSSENLNILITKQKFAAQRKKFKKKSKSFLLKEPPKLFSKNLKTNDSTSLKSRHSYNRENSAKKDTSSLLKQNSLNTNKNRFIVIRKKKLKCVKNVNNIKNIKKLNKVYSRENTLSETAKKIRVTKSILKTQKSYNELKAIEPNNKLTPRSTHQSPQYSHRTPDSVKISQRSSIPVLTEKKSKIPEVGYFCKRFSLFDKNKCLYVNQSNNFNEKESEKNNLSIKNPKKKKITSENIIKNEEFSLITKTLKLDEPQVENNTSPLKIRRDSNFQSIETLNRSEVFENLPIETDDFENDHINNPFPIQSYTSPTKMISMCNSPEQKKIITPETSSKNKSGKNEPKAPKKGLAEYESPGSFVFSLSSNTSEEEIPRDSDIVRNLSTEKSYLSSNPFSFKKDEGIQTDLLEIMTDSRLLEGLKIIERIS